MTDQPEPEDTCRPVDIDGETIRVRGAAELSPESQAALTSLVRAAKAKMAAEPPPVRQQLRAAAFNAVAPALKRHDEWLRLTVRRSIADAVLTAIEEFLDIGDAEAWCKICRRVWDGKGHQCEGHAEQRLDRVRGLVAGAAHSTAAGISDYDIGRHELARDVLAVVDARSAPAAVAGQPITEEQAEAVRAANLPPCTRVTRAVVEEAMRDAHRREAQLRARAADETAEMVRTSVTPIVDRPFRSHRREFQSRAQAADMAHSTGCPQCGATSQCPLHAQQPKEQ